MYIHICIFIYAHTRLYIYIYSVNALFFVRTNRKVKGTSASFR